MNLLTAQSLSKSYGPRTLFSDLDMAVDEGEKIGLVGPNGCGKSTLLKILAGQIDADGGLVTRRREARVRYVSQDPEFAPGILARDAVAEVVAPAREAIEAFERLTAKLAAASPMEVEALLEEQTALQARIERLGGWQWEHQVETVLDKLGIQERDMDRPVAELSGGQRRRVALARVLLDQPDLMMLDEPTNHLDAETLEWMEQALIDYPGAVLLITHDRYFLDRVVTRIIEFDEDGLHSCAGGYAQFIERKLERDRVRQKAESRRQKLLSRELEWLSRSPSARTTKARARIDRAETLQDQAPNEARLDLNLHFEAERRLGGIILEGHGMTFAYGDHPVFEGLHLAIQRHEKIGVLGPNGCGKTTMLRAMMGEERLSAGTITWGRNTRPGYMSQARDDLNPEDTVLDAFSPNEHVHVGNRSVHKRTYLKDFLFEDGEQRKLVSALSGGERCRLLLARLMLQGANLLILDEPTNDLDIVSLQLLEEALRDFQGCVLMVTHDRYFLNKVCNVIMAFEDGKLERYDGDYDFYRARRDARLLEERRARAEERKAEAEAQAQARAEARTQLKKLSWKERKELEEIEGVILEVETQKEEVEAALADPDLYQSRPDEITGLTRQLEELGARIDALYARWEDLESRSQE